MEYYEVDYFVFHQDRLIVLGDQNFREVLGDNIPIIPKHTLDDVLSNCVFLMLSEKNNIPAAFISKESIEGKNICAFYEKLYSKGRKKKIKMILHEIAHYVLDHHNKGLSKEEYIEQEKAANEQRDKWIDDYEKDLKAQEGEKNRERG
jgi:hypothetical protein